MSLAPSIATKDKKVQIQVNDSTINSNSNNKKKKSMKFLDGLKLKPQKKSQFSPLMFPISINTPDEEIIDEEGKESESPDNIS